MKTAKTYVIILLLVGAGALAVWQIVPRYLISKAHKMLLTDGCRQSPSETKPKAPGRRFYDAVEMLQTAAMFPGFGKGASDIRNHAALQCQGNLLMACMEMTHWAYDRALDHARNTQDANMAAAKTPAERAKIVQAHDATVDAFDKKNPKWLERWLPSEERTRFCKEWSRFASWVAKEGSPATCPVCP
jgi:hypothetical protein